MSQVMYTNNQNLTSMIYRGENQDDYQESLSDYEEIKEQNHEPLKIARKQKEPSLFNR